MPIKDSSISVTLRQLGFAALWVVGLACGVVGVAGTLYIVDTEDLGSPSGKVLDCRVTGLTLRERATQGGSERLVRSLDHVDCENGLFVGQPGDRTRFTFDELDRLSINLKVSCDLNKTLIYGISQIGVCRLPS